MIKIAIVNVLTYYDLLIILTIVKNMMYYDIFLTKVNIIYYEYNIM